MFENKLINEVHVSRYIASWINSGGNLGHGHLGRFNFVEWLKSLGLSDEEAIYIFNYATCGRLELESSARKFIKTLPK